MDYPYILPEDELRRRLAKGDEAAGHWLIERFKLDNSDLPIVAGGVLIQFNVSQGHILMSLNIAEGMSLEAIRQNWHVIAEWRRRLTEWQGPWKGRQIFSSRARLLDYLTSRQGDMSPREMADWVNRIIVSDLQRHIEIEGESLFGGETFSRIEALLILQWLGINEDEAHQWCLVMIDEMKAGRPAFPQEGGPVDLQRIREQLRYWRKTRGGKK